MYMLVLDWFEDGGSNDYSVHVLPANSADVALKLAHRIAYTKDGFEKYDRPKNIYLYGDVDCLEDSSDIENEKYHGYTDDDCFLASWMDVDKNIHR